MPKAKPKAKMTAKKSAAKPASKPLTGHKAQAYSYASEQEEEDLSKINDDPVDFGFDPTPYFESAEGSPSIGGTFRGSPSPRATNIPAHIVDLGKDWARLRRGSGVLWAASRSKNEKTIKQIKR